jgi:hypothetical protein
LAIGAIAVAGLAGSAAASPHHDKDTVQESNLGIEVGVSAGIDMNPDLTELLPPAGDDFPAFAQMSGNENTFPTPQSRVTADVGLPNNFNNGAHGIDFSELSIRTTNAPGAIFGFGAISVPMDLTGSDVQLIAFTASLSYLDIVLNTPFSSSLTPTGNPNEWLWSGLADVTISGALAPKVVVPTVQTVELGPYDFSQQVTIPLAGLFSGDGLGTMISVSIPSGTLQDQDLGLAPISEDIDIAELGLVTGTFSLDTLTLADISTAIVYRNVSPIPEPGTAALLGAGLAGIALRSRRRRSQA